METFYAKGAGGDVHEIDARPINADVYPDSQASQRSDSPPPRLSTPSRAKSSLKNELLQRLLARCPAVY